METKTKNFSLSIKAPVTAADAFKKINQVNAWWAKNFTGKAEKLNDTFRVSFGPTFVDFKITKCVPNQKVVWHVTDCFLHWINNKTEWTGTEVVFGLSENAGVTKINFTHVGLTPDVECYKDCFAGWTGHVKGSLLQLLNTGKGMPE
ncbi:MAG: SRPBCC domain-containing protein [Bacteroidia bacterium]